MWSGNVQKVPKSRISLNFDQFSDPLRTLSPPVVSKKNIIRVHNLLKTSINLYYLNMYSILTFIKWKCSKSAQNVIFMQFWPILGPYDPLKGPLHYQESTFKGSYSLKSLHKLVLQENVSNSVFFELKVHLQCLKVGVRGAKSSKF